MLNFVEMYVRYVTYVQVTVERNKGVSLQVHSSLLEQLFALTGHSVSLDGALFQLCDCDRFDRIFVQTVQILTDTQYNSLNPNIQMKITQVYEYMTNKKKTTTLQNGKYFFE